MNVSKPNTGLPGAVKRRFNVLRRLAGGQVGRLGQAVEYENGFKFYPAVTSRRPSTVLHPSLEACLPRWVGYPDRCETVAVTPQAVRP